MLKKENTACARFLRVHQGNRLLKVYVTTIQMIRADSNYRFIHLLSGERLYTSRTLKSFMVELDEDDFLRCHRSYLVNKKEIREIDKCKNVIVMRDGTTIPVSRRYMRACVRAIFSDFTPQYASLSKPQWVVHKRIRKAITGAQESS